MSGENRLGAASPTACCHFCGTKTTPEAHVNTTGAWICPTCRYVECHPRPSRRELQDLYGDIGYHRFNTNLEELVGEVRGHAKFTERLAKLLPSGAMVVEVGAATGALVKAMRLRGLDARGMDISAAAAHAAKELLDVDVEITSAEEAVYPSGVQAIVAFHVLEHLLQPRDFLTCVSQMLPTGGWLVLEVPDYDARMRTQLGPRWPYYLPGEHLQHFSEATFRNILPRFGFAVRHVDRVGGLGILQKGRGLEGNESGSESESSVPMGWRGRLYSTRSTVYAVPGARRFVRYVNGLVGYGLLHRNAHVRVWAQKFDCGSTGGI